MKTPHRFAQTMLVLAALASASAAHAATWNIPGNFANLQAAISSVSVENGDTITIDAGTYLNPATTATINKSVTITGSGVGSTIISHTTNPGTDVPLISITAANVTIENLTVRYGTGPAVTLLYRGAGITTTAANTTIENVEFDINYARRGIFVNNNSTNPIIRNCIFKGYMNREVIDINNNTNVGAGTLTIEGNIFQEGHYQQGPILVDGASGANVIIRNNLFINRVGVYDTLGNLPLTGDYGFQGDGSTLYSVYVGSLTAGRTVELHNNTFVYQDSSTQNVGGYVPQFIGIHAPGTITAGQVTVRDNILTGFNTERPAYTKGHSFDTTGGIFGGALSMDGANSFGTFLSNAGFDIGAKGTLSVWVKLNNIGKRHQILEGPGNGGLEWQYRSNSGGQFYMRPYADTDYVISSGSMGITNWKLVQYTWDQGTAIARVYSGDEATPVAEQTYLVSNNENISPWPAPVDTTTGTFNFGTDPGDAARRFGGLMDDLVIFDDVLSPAELESLRTGGASAFSADARLAAHFPFEETSGDSASSVANGLTINFVDARDTNKTWAINAGALVNIDNNLFFDNDVAYNNGTADANEVLGDPLFVGSGATAFDVYTPGPGSPAIGAASDSGTIGAVFVAVPTTQPTVDTNSILYVEFDATETITTANLSVSDPEQGPSALTFTVTTPPTLGTLSLGTFTQQDIADGNLTYTNTGNGTSDSFAFSVTDGVTAPVTGTFNIGLISSTDTDCDGIQDDLEVILGLDPNNADTDGDGIPDGLERALGTNANSINDPTVGGVQVDADGDRIPDSIEIGLGLNPNSADTDGDGIRDDWEILKGTDADDNSVYPFLGDANESGDKGDFDDAIEILRFTLNLAVINVANPDDLDVNRDCRIGLIDAIIVYNFDAGNISALPFP